MPTQNNIEYVTSVLSDVGLNLVFHDFNSWGKSEIVVNEAAATPTKIIISIFVALSMEAVMMFNLGLA